MRRLPEPVRIGITPISATLALGGSFWTNESKFVAESWATHSEQFSSFNLVAAANTHHSVQN